MKRLVLTGAAGRLGQELRAPLAALCDTLVSSDIAPLQSPELPNETYIQADLADMEAVTRVIDGADMVIHFGAIPDERPFETLLGPNFVGAYNVYEAAHQAGVRRVVYASSIHAVGMHKKADRIGADAAHRPDTFYGLSKCFTEDLARMYWEKRGLESVCCRICSCTEVPTNARALGSWLSYPDLVRMVTRAIDTPVTEFTIVYGVSANDRNPLDPTAGAHIGFRPQDNAEVHAERVLAEEPPADPQDQALACHGGPFATVPLGESGVAQMKMTTG